MFYIKISNDMILKGCVVEVKKSSTLSFFTDPPTSYTAVVEYRFENEEKAKEFYYKVKDNPDLIKKMIG
jgi:hypothetical protein